ncbi:MAG TPA: hypothetical protein VK772_15025 [Puia sp.]|nr:hypothetical protein [Puia sp.]
MRKFLLSLLPMIFISAFLNAQSYKGSLLFQKNIYSVAAIQVTLEEGVVNDAVKDYMSRKGFKDSHFKDFIVFRSVPLDSGSAVVADTYFSIEKKSHSEKDLITISLLPVKKGETISPSTIVDSSLMKCSLVYLDSLKHYVLSYSLKQDIKAQQKAVDKIKSNLLSLKNDSGDIAKKIRGYQSDLVENKNDQDKETRALSLIATGDQAALSKAHNKMNKLLDNQSDYEKKLRNAQAALEKNTQDRGTQQSLLEKETQALDALKKRHQDLGMVNP